MLYCPRCRQTYTPGHVANYIHPRSCPNCGNKRLLYWDVVWCMRELLNSMKKRRRVGP